MDNVMRIPMKIFLDYLGMNPYKVSPWSTLPIRRYRIAVTSTHDKVLYTSATPNDVFYDREVHEARVAYLVENWLNDGSDPIDVEIFHELIVHDGYHRIAAAIYREDEFIYAEVGGYLEEAEEMGWE